MENQNAKEKMIEAGRECVCVVSVVVTSPQWPLFIPAAGLITRRYSVETGAEAGSGSQAVD